MAKFVLVICVVLFYTETSSIQAAKAKFTPFQVDKDMDPKFQAMQMVLSVINLNETTRLREEKLKLRRDRKMGIKTPEELLLLRVSTLEENISKVQNQLKNILDVAPKVFNLFRRLGIPEYEISEIALEFYNSTESTVQPSTTEAAMVNDTLNLVETATPTTSEENDVSIEWVFQGDEDMYGPRA